MKSKKPFAIQQLITASLLMLGGLGFAGSAQAGTLTPPSFSNYRYVFGDAVTGDNAFKGTDNRYHWFVNTGADSYATDEYERPTIQNYEDYTFRTKVGSDSELTGAVSNQTKYHATAASGPSYFEYLDIVTGRFDYDENFMYFAIELYGDSKVDSNGDSNGGKRTYDFGESSVYRIRVGEKENANNSLLLSTEIGKDVALNTFRTEKNFAYYDQNGSVGGTSITTVDEENKIANFNGYEKDVVADGKAKDARSAPVILSSRRITNSAGKPVVEFAFDYKKYNSLFPNSAKLDPTNGLPYLVFEANRGTKDKSNYLWNDKYTIGEAGTPYKDAHGDPQNVYELDTLRGKVVTFSAPPVKVPEPGTTTALALAVVGTVKFLKRKAAQA